MHGLLEESVRTETNGHDGRNTHYSAAELDIAKQRLGEGINLEIYCGARAAGESHQSALQAPFRVE